VLVIISKIYFLCKNFLIGISLIKVLIFPSALIIVNQAKHSLKNNIFITNNLKGKQLKKIKYSNNFKYKREIGEIDQIMRNYGLVDIQELDSNIIVSLQYATTNNFLKKNIYGSLTHAFLQKDVAEKLINASNNLIGIMPNCRFVILDAARPLSLQKIMWNEAQILENDKEKYIANPIYGSLHNYGAAIDLTLADSSGKWFDMGTPFDSFDELSYPSLETDFIKTGKLTPKQINNRLILRSAMTFAGFSYIATEWWHFSSCSFDYAKKHYPLIVSHILAETPSFNNTIKTKNIIPEFKEPKAKDINFRVQIITSDNELKITDKIFKGNKVEKYYHNGLFKYTTGKYKTLEEAYKQLIQMQNNGFSDAFIVAFNKNNRIGIKDASELIQ